MRSEEELKAILDATKDGMFVEEPSPFKQIRKGYYEYANRRKPEVDWKDQLNSLWPIPISVEERLPEEYVDVLGWDGRKWDVTCIAEDKSSGMVGWYYIGAGGDDYYDGKSITHWLELPPKPE